MKKIAILGSTGKIGSQTLEVIRSYPKEFKIISLVCNSPSKKFSRQIKEFKPQKAVIFKKDGYQKLIQAVADKEVDLVVVAVVGLAGLMPVLTAIKRKKNIALATKEVLVLAGKKIMAEVKKNKVDLIPLDSEHSAIFQALRAGSKKEIKKIFLTMGRGSIAKMSQKQLTQVTMKDIYNRPNWSMGAKIAVDSATCVNKAFEVIEAKWLFGLKPEQIKIVVHPEYLCHSLVEFIDGSYINEIGRPDMKRYIQYALFYPQRREFKFKSDINLYGKKISFLKPPIKKFPCLNLGFVALKNGGTMPAVFHGADRAAVEAFIAGKIKFTQIPAIIKAVMKKHQTVVNPDIKEIISQEQWAFNQAQKILAKKRLKK